MDINKHGSILPYINISSPFGRSLKFLIDTGASSSFINPEFIDTRDVEKCEPMTISTVLHKYDLTDTVTLPMFKEIGQPGVFTFLVFKFHGYFDGLLGLDYLKKIGAKVDLKQNKLIAGNISIPLQMKPNLSSDVYKIPPNSKQIVKLPVDKEEGDIFLGTVSLDNGLYISPGLYYANAWFSVLEIINPTDEEQTIFLEQPIKTDLYNSVNFIELNNLNVTPIQCHEDDRKLSELIRTGHLNSEERKLLFRLCRKYDDIF